MPRPNGDIGTDYRDGLPRSASVLMVAPVLRCPLPTLPVLHRFTHMETEPVYLCGGMNPFRSAGRGKGGSIHLELGGGGGGGEGEAWCACVYVGSAAQGHMSCCCC